MTASLSRISDSKEWAVRNLTIIGRDSDLYIHLNSTNVSREHAMIRKQDGEYFLYDLDSANGTRLNGRRVDRPVPIAHGDIIELGSVVLTFKWPGKNARHLAHKLERTKLEAVPTPMTILVADLKNYSQICHDRQLVDLAKVMIPWYERCREILIQAGAEIDKFIGDCVLAYWLSTDTETRANAVAAARGLHISKRPAPILHGAGQQPAAEDPDLRCGVSLHVGSPLLGAMLPGQRTVMGDDVNIAFRLEELTRKLQAPILASEAFVTDFDEGASLFEERGQREIKGYPPVGVFALRMVPTDATTAGEFSERLRSIENSRVIGAPLLVD